MLKLESVGEIIATREFTLDGEKKVTVLIGKPQRLPSDKKWDDWYCPYQKLGIENDRVKCIYGVDALQALLLALAAAGVELYCSDAYKAGRLRWDCGSVKGDLGIPVAKSVQDILPPGASGY